MKFLVTGVNGQLGYDVKKELLARGYEDLLCPSRDELDITKKEDVKRVILEYCPDVIIHCAAYTAVDKAEEEKDICYNVNVNGTRYLLTYAKEVGAKFIYISTDYVFDGSKDGSYKEDDDTSPINYYGQTKLLGEKLVCEYFNHVIVRISWVFGINGNNFVKTILRLSTSKNELGVVCDQVGSPTYTKDLARLLVDMAISDKTGIYHVTNEGYCSWNEFAKYIFEVNDIDMVVNPVLSKDYKTVAKRPLNSKMDKSKLVRDGFVSLPDWKDAVLRYSEELKKEGKIL